MYSFGLDLFYVYLLIEYSFPLRLLSCRNGLRKLPSTYFGVTKETYTGTVCSVGTLVHKFHMHELIGSYQKLWIWKLTCRLSLMAWSCHRHSMNHLALTLPSNYTPFPPPQLSFPPTCYTV